MVLSVRAIFKASAAHAPPDATRPHERLAGMLGNSGALALLGSGLLPTATAWTGFSAQRRAAHAERRTGPGVR
jgi:hypothetical protein